MRSPRRSTRQDRAAGDIDRAIAQAGGPQPLLDHLRPPQPLPLPQSLPPSPLRPPPSLDSSWPSPRPIEPDLPPAPLCDVNQLLPPELAVYVTDEAGRMPCPPDMIAAPVVVLLGAAMGACCGIKPKRHDDWLVTPNLYGGVVGDPASKKSPAIALVMRQLDRLEEAIAKTQAVATTDYECELAAYEASLAALRGVMKQAADKRDDLMMDAAVADMAKLKRPVPQNGRRFKSNDATVEKLAELLVANPTGLLVFRDELVGLMQSWEKQGHESDRGFYLEGWNGTSSYSIDRIGRGSSRIPNHCLSLFGGIQPDLLESYLSNAFSASKNDGLFQRFQLLVYPGPVTWQWVDRPPIAGSREAVQALFERLAAFDPVKQGAAPADASSKLPHFRFDDEAQGLFIAWSSDLHLNRMARETNPLVRQHLAKFEKLFCSVALIMHAVLGHVGPIRQESAAHAAAWCDFMEGHARRIYGLIEAAQVSTAAQLGRRLVEGKLPDNFTARQVLRKNWSGLNTMTQVEAALAVLEDHHWIRSEESDTLMGRPTTRYRINPEIFKRE